MSIAISLLLECHVGWFLLVLVATPLVMKELWLSQMP